ncbi:alpha/beta hydrolase [Streptococcaceae bacterium ESL0729]|nr:alpha/beta hydrolase [Streptococcaceae bacterium ESL0729]
MSDKIPLEIIEQEKSFQARDGLKLSLKLIRPIKDEEVKGTLQIIHGMNEHALRYGDLARYLAGHGYAVFTSDNRGHGLSFDNKNPLSHISSLDQMIEDQLQISGLIKKAYPRLPLTLYGHSFGSMIARAYLDYDDSMLAGLILTGTVKYQFASKIGKIILDLRIKALKNPKTSKFLNSLVAPGASSKDWITSDQTVLDLIEKDRLWVESYDDYGLLAILEANHRIKYMSKKAGKNLVNKKLPILSINGQEDIVTGGSKGLLASKRFLEVRGYENLDFITMPQMKHEVINELEKEVVYQIILTFLDKENRS